MKVKKGQAREIIPMLLLLKVFKNALSFPLGSAKFIKPSVILNGYRGFFVFELISTHEHQFFIKIGAAFFRTILS